MGAIRHFAKEAGDMRAKKKVDRPKAGFLTKVVIVVLLAAIGCLGAGVIAYRRKRW